MSKKITDSMLRALHFVVQTPGREHVKPQAQTIKALQSRGLIDADGLITFEGVERLGLLSVQRRIAQLAYRHSFNLCSVAGMSLSVLRQVLRGFGLLVHCGIDNLAVGYVQRIKLALNRAGRDLVLGCKKPGAGRARNRRKSKRKCDAFNARRVRQQRPKIRAFRLHALRVHNEIAKNERQLARFKQHPSFAGTEGQESWRLLKHQHNRGAYVARLAVRRRREHMQAQGFAL